MKSRVVGIIKFEAPRMDGRGSGFGLNFASGEEGMALETWLAALVGETTDSGRFECQERIAPIPRRLRANLEQLAEELDREYLELAAT